jgi:hypothetical protein
MNRKILGIVIGTLGWAGRLLAEQGGGGHYVPGATASFMDALPDEPGLVAENLYLNYNTPSSTGLHVLPFGQDVAGGVKADVHADRIQLLYMFEPKILGGHYAVAAAPSMVWEQMSGGGIPYEDPIPSPVKRVTAGSAFGFGDLEFWPLMLGWKNGDFKYDARCAVYAPTGDYNKNAMANPGLGYWTFEPGVSFSWLSSQFGTEVSVFSGMDFNTKNTDSDYQSGDIVHVDVTVAQHLALGGGSAGLGVNGFYYKQVTADSGSGIARGSFETMSEGVGPVVSYVHNLGKHPLAIEAKWLPETQVHNTTKGNYVWAKISYAF